MSYSDVTFQVDDRRKRGYYTIDNVLLDVYGQQLKAHGIAVYNALARFANDVSECWPSYKTITNRTGVSRAQIIREIAKMEELGIISVTRRVAENGNRTSHLYTLLDIVGGGISQTPGGISQTPKQSPLKKYIPKQNKKKMGAAKNNGNSYRPPADIDPISR